MRRTALRRTSALRRKASCSSLDMDGSRMRVTPCRPMTPRRQGDTVLGVVSADRQHGLLVVQHCFGDARRNESDAKLTRLVAFDDRDVGVADVVFDAVAEFVNHGSRGQGVRDRHTANPSRRPQQYLLPERTDARKSPP